MLFNSSQFVLFYIIVFFLYYLMPHKFRWILILISSYIFYMSWKVEFIILILLSTVTTYIVGYLLDKSSEKFVRNLLLLISLVINLGILFTFKYYIFFIDNFITFFNFFGIALPIPQLDLLLPVGISFYTFQTLSYTIDVYLRKISSEKHFGYFAAYVAFFPQLVAGPIERAKNLLPQFIEKHNLSYERFSSGIQLVLLGMYKKIVVADLIAVVVNNVYSKPEIHSPPILILATLFFAIQIYCDFSGYSDIAIGIARTLGFELMLNFKQPYFARSIQEFWQRWHISLSTWFRDYIYIPLGGNRVPRFRWYLNIMIVFILSGLWHGANWTFIIWGGLHGLGLILEAWIVYLGRNIFTDSFPPILKSIIVLIRILLVFTFVCIGWVFFRSESLSDSVYIITQFVNLPAYQDFTLNQLFTLGLPRFEMVWAFIAISTVLGFDFINSELPTLKHSIWRFKSVRLILCIIVIYAIVFFGVFDTVDFIYFQF